MGICLLHWVGVVYVAAFRCDWTAVIGKPRCLTRWFYADLLGCAIIEAVPHFYRKVFASRICHQFAVALQRLTPFLDQPKGLFALLLLGLLTRGVLGIATRIGWSVHGGLRASAAIGFAVLALFLWKDAFTPETAAARRTPLVTQLHWGYLWLGLGFALEAWAQTYGDVGLAPLHALTLGFMCTTLVAMVSRVTAVNYGRSVAVDTWLWFLQVILQVTTLARLINVLYPTGTGLFRLIAVTGFMLVALGWSARYLPWLLQPKPPRQLV